MKLSVILVTDDTHWLQNTLWGLETQTVTEFDLQIANFGNADQVRNLQIVSTKQPGNGIDPVELLSGAKHDYIVFMHGNSLARRDFLAIHQRRAATGRILTGKYYSLPYHAARAITREDIFWGRCFDFLWLREKGLPPTANRTRLTSGLLSARVLDSILPAGRHLTSGYLSGWKKDLLSAAPQTAPFSSPGDVFTFVQNLHRQYGHRLTPVTHSAVSLQLANVASQPDISRTD